jgi:hypothetical protein
LIFLFAAVGFTAAAPLMVHDSKVRASAFNTAMAYTCIVFFGLGVVVFLVMILVYGVFRKPVLEIDAQGWRYMPPLLVRGQSVAWQNLGDVGVYRQSMTRSTTYYLVAHARNPQGLPGRRVRAFGARLYPSLAGAALIVPLNTVFLRQTPAKCQHLLERIAQACAPEIHHHGVRVARDVRDL